MTAFASCSPAPSRWVVVFVTLASLTVCDIADAAIIQVTTAGDVGSASTCTLRQAITTMNYPTIGGSSCANSSTDSFGVGVGGNDKITFAPGITTITLADVPGNSLLIADPNLIIEGTGMGGVVVERPSTGKNAFPVFVVQKPPPLVTVMNLNLHGLTIRNGTASSDGPGAGGGIQGLLDPNLGVSVNLGVIDCIITQNKADFSGGGILADQLSLVNSVVSGNSSGSQTLGAGFGGGITAKKLTVSGSSVSANTSFQGGGIYAQRATLIDSTVDANSAQFGTNGFGGGLYVIGDLLISNTTISGNTSSGDGGGIYATLPNGDVDLGGGAKSYACSNIEILNSTVAFNSAAGNGGGMQLLSNGCTTYVFGTQIPTIAINSSIFSDNQASSAAVGDMFYASGPGSQEALTITGGKNLVRNPNGFLQFANAPLSTDPLLQSLANNGGATKTHALGNASPAIDAGDASATQYPSNTLADQRGPGYARTAGAAPDIGAFEVQTGASSAFANMDQHGMTGSWYNAATSGQGFEIEVYPDIFGPGQGQMAMAWFTFDTTGGDATKQRWYTLQGSVSNSASAALDIYAGFGGHFAAGPAVTPQKVGKATLSYADCTHATLSYAFADGSSRVGSIALTRIDPNVTCAVGGDNGSTPGNFLLSGGWYDPSASGQGFLFDVSPSLNLFFAAWFSYGNPGVDAHGASLGYTAASQRWFTFSSFSFTPGSNALSAIPIVSVSNGVFNDPAKTASSTVGSADIAFQSCNAMTLTYHFTDGENKGMSSTINLQRIVPISGGCGL